MERGSAMRPFFRRPSAMRRSPRLARSSWNGVRGLASWGSSVSARVMGPARRGRTTRTRGTAEGRLGGLVPAIDVDDVRDRLERVEADTRGEDDGEGRLLRHEAGHGVEVLHAHEEPEIDDEARREQTFTEARALGLREGPAHVEVHGGGGEKRHEVERVPGGVEDEAREDEDEHGLGRPLAQGPQDERHGDEEHEVDGLGEGHGVLRVAAFVPRVFASRKALQRSWPRTP
jgi:hypothetical protein